MKIKPGQDKAQVMGAYARLLKARKAKAEAEAALDKIEKSLREATVEYHALGFTTRETAEVSGVSRTTVSNWANEE